MSGQKESLVLAHYTFSVNTGQSSSNVFVLQRSRTGLCSCTPVAKKRSNIVERLFSHHDDT